MAILRSGSSYAFCYSAARPPALLQYHPHWDPHCVFTTRTAAASRSALGSDFSCATRVRLHRDPCVRIDIRASARILMYNLLYLFKIGARPEIHLSTYFGHIANRVSAMSSFLRFSSFFFFSYKLKPNKRSNLIQGVLYSLYIQNTRYLVLFRDKNQIEYVYNLGLSSLESLYQAIWSLGMPGTST